MNQAKRVATLYRVSTAKQLDDDDIPMQRNACISYIQNRTDWQLVHEYVEKGVSGYKISANDRDIIQQVFADAKLKKFDILLVFKSDRISRISDEYNPTINRLSNAGIEICSVTDGDLTIHNHTDSLLSFTRGWSNENESRRISAYTDEKHKQMTMQGLYRGGAVPFGYELMKQGRYSERDKNQRMELYTLVINPSEAEIIKLIFSLVSDKGWGGTRIAKYLNEHNIPSREDTGWCMQTINYILRNPIYKGYPTYGKTTRKKDAQTYRQDQDKWISSKDQVEALVIISEDDWNKVSEIRCKRNPLTKKDKSETIQYPTRSNLLFIGLAYCGHCGKPLTTTHHEKSRTNKDGKKHYTKTLKYRCSGKATGSTECTGQTVYAQQKVEKAVMLAVMQYLDSITNIDFSSDIDKIKSTQIAGKTKELTKANNTLKETEKELSALEKEVAKSLLGKSPFKKGKLSELITEKETEIEGLKQKKIALSSEIEKCTIEMQDLTRLKEAIPNWTKVFDNADIDDRKMLLRGIIRKILVYRDKIEVLMRVKISELTSLLDADDSQLKVVRGSEAEKVLEQNIQVAL